MALAKSRSATPRVSQSWGVMPVVRVERHQVGDGKPGVIARALREKWLA